MLISMLNNVKMLQKIFLFGEVCFLHLCIKQMLMYDQTILSLYISVFKPGFYIIFVLFMRHLKVVVKQQDIFVLFCSPPPPVWLDLLSSR
jgi:hypothetical protein